jgi:predicted transglutaminase-like cysteine proteinase
MTNICRRTARHRWLSVLAATGVAWLLCIPPATAGYQFDNTDDYLTDASALPAWASTLRQHEEERRLIQRCLENDSDCEKRLRSLRHVLLKGADLPKDKQLSLVNRYVNRRNYKRDHRKTAPSVTGAGEARLINHWTTLLGFMRRGGDCEDYATAKYFMLRELGFEADAMRVLVTYDRRARAYHAVLAVRREDGSAWLLETDNTIRRQMHGQYRFIYAVNENGIWLHEK